MGIVDLGGFDRMRAVWAILLPFMTLVVDRIVLYWSISSPDSS